MVKENKYKPYHMSIEETNILRKKNPLPKFKDKEFCLSDYIFCSCEDDTIDAFRVKEFLRLLKEGCKKQFKLDKPKYSINEIIDKLAGDKLI